MCLLVGCALWVCGSSGDSVLWLLGRRLNLFSRDSHQVRSGFPSGKKDPHDFSKNRACLFGNFPVGLVLLWGLKRGDFLAQKGAPKIGQKVAPPKSQTKQKITMSFGVQDNL